MDQHDDALSYLFRRCRQRRFSDPRCADPVSELKVSDRTPKRTDVTLHPRPAQCIQRLLDNAPVIGREPPLKDFSQ
jgi:hypothetical protein